MSRLEQLKEEVAKKIGFKDYDDARHDLDESFIFEFAKIYAEECVKASLEKASDKIFYYVDNNRSEASDVVANRENIVLL